MKYGGGGGGLGEKASLYINSAVINPSETNQRSRLLLLSVKIIIKILLLFIFTSVLQKDKS